MTVALVKEKDPVLVICKPEPLLTPILSEPVYGSWM